MLCCGTDLLARHTAVGEALMTKVIPVAHQLLSRYWVLRYVADVSTIEERSCTINDIVICFFLGTQREIEIGSSGVVICEWINSTRTRGSYRFEDRCRVLRPRRQLTTKNPFCSTRRNGSSCSKLASVIDTTPTREPVSWRGFMHCLLEGLRVWLSKRHASTHTSCNHAMEER